MDITGLSPSTGLTLEAWVRRDPQTNAGNNEGIVGKYAGSTFGNNRSYDLYYDPRTGGRVGFVLGNPLTGGFNANFDLKSPTDIPLDQWVHLAATYEPSVSGMPTSGRTALYVNGQLVAEATGTTNVPDFLWDSSIPFWIGQQFSDDPSTTFEGSIDEVAVYDKPLTATDIAAHFAAATNDTPASYDWVPNGSGSWHNAANWSPSAVPTGNTVSINFGTAITAAKVVYTESAITAKSIRFDNNNKYAIAGVGTITLSSNSGNASIQVVRGAQEFQTPVTLGSNTDIDVAAGAGNSLSFNNVLNLGGKTLNLQTGAVNINHSVIPGTGGQIVNGSGAVLGTAGATSLGGNLTNTGTLAVELGGKNTNEFSAFNVGGTATLAGFVSPVLVNGFTLTSGDSFTILTAGNLINSGISLSGPLASAMSMSVVGNSLVLTAGLSGDFNIDGKVDAADYVTWRKGLGTTYTQSDYNAWRSNFGASSGAGSGAVLGAAVPEPVSLVLILAACPMLIGMRRRIRR